jgi:hypothetical protein
LCWCDELIKMLAFLYKIFTLLVLFAGGYALLRFGMNVDEKTSLYIAIGAMPVATFLIWLISYRGKQFR